MPLLKWRGQPKLAAVCLVKKECGFALQTEAAVKRFSTLATEKEDGSVSSHGKGQMQVPSPATVRCTNLHTSCKVLGPPKTPQKIKYPQNRRNKEVNKCVI
eukprot:4793831-Amphidinium_carterae.1